MFFKYNFCLLKNLFKPNCGLPEPTQGPLNTLTTHFKDTYNAWFPPENLEFSLLEIHRDPWNPLKYFRKPLRTRSVAIVANQELLNPPKITYKHLQFQETLSMVPGNDSEEPLATSKVLLYPHTPQKPLKKLLITPQEPLRPCKDTTLRSTALMKISFKIFL